MAKNEKKSKVILEGLFWTGAVSIAMTSPYFLHKLIPKLIRHAKYKIENKRRLQYMKNTFYYLKRRGYIKMEKRSGQIYISITKEGKKTMKRYNFDNLKVEKSKKWDGKWRVFMFDVANQHKVKREALRGKLKELGFVQLQKSIWIIPFDFSKEAEIIRNFFDFSQSEMRVIESAKIADDFDLRQKFNLG